MGGRKWDRKVSGMTQSNPRALPRLCLQGKEGKEGKLLGRTRKRRPGKGARDPGERGQRLPEVRK